MQVGDLITTDKDCSQDVLIQVEGRNKFMAQAGQFRGNRAIRVTKVLQQSLEPGEKPVEKPAEKPAEKVTDKAVEKPGVKQ